VTGATRYRVSVGSKSGNSDVDQLTTTQTVFSSAILRGGIYFARVQAGHTCGFSATSNELRVPVGYQPESRIIVESDAGDPIGQGQSRTINASNEIVSTFACCGRTEVSAGFPNSWFFNFTAPRFRTRVEPGTYENATVASIGRQTDQPGLWSRARRR
jgi:hypothetical protein